MKKRMMSFLCLILCLFFPTFAEKTDAFLVAEPVTAVLGEGAAAVPGISTKRFYRNRTNENTEKGTPVPADVIIVSDKKHLLEMGDWAGSIEETSDQEEAVTFFKGRPVGETEIRNRVVIVAVSDKLRSEINNSWVDILKRKYGATVYAIGNSSIGSREEKERLLSISSNNGMEQNPSYCFFAPVEDFGRIIQEILNTVKGLTHDRLILQSGQ